MQEAKKEKKQVNKRKLEHDKLDTTKRIETKTRRRLTKDKPQVSAQTPPRATKQVERRNRNPLCPTEGAK